MLFSFIATWHPDKCNSYFTVLIQKWETHFRLAQKGGFPIEIETKISKVIHIA